MKVPGPLSPAARRLLELGAVVEPPTAEQNARMDRALAPLLGSGRTNALAEAATPVRAERIRLTGGHLGAELAARPGARLSLLQRSLQQRLAVGGTQVALALGALAATAGASFWLGRASTPVIERSQSSASPPAPLVELDGALAERAPLPPPQPARELAEAAVPSPAPASERLGTPAASVQATPAAPAALPTRAAARPSNARARREERNSPASLALEIERMGRVEAALRHGQPARALEDLERSKTEILVEQAAALRAVASCQSGVDDAALAALEVLRRWPSSPFRARIREACGL